MSFLKPFWKSNQRGHVSITLLGSQRKAYFNFLSPLQTRMIRMLKSTSRHKPLRDSCRAPNLLQIAYLDLLIDRPRTKVHLNKQQAFATSFSHSGERKIRNFHETFICLRQSSGSCWKHVEFLLFAGVPLSLFLSKSFAFFGVEKKLGLIQPSHRLDWTSLLDLCDRKILGVAKISFSCSQP